jgi:TorA maturation chaperone TorD
MTTSTEYHFLSLCLLYPQADLLPRLQETAAATGQPWATEMVEAFARESLEALQIEHTRLFVNNIEGVPCPPYESAYVDGQLLTATTAAVAAFYEEWGLRQAAETADYLPVELQFLAYLLALESQAEDAQAIEMARQQFETEHLLRWLPRFAIDLQESAQITFYQKTGIQLAALGHRTEI